MALNPRAFTFWLFAASLGYAIGGGFGLSIGLAIATGLSFTFDCFF